MLNCFLCLLTVSIGFNTPCLGEANPEISGVTICEISRNPSLFDNKIVRIRATLTGNFEISAIRDPGNEECGSLWFTYPGSGPSAFVSFNGLTPMRNRPTIILRRDGRFKHFQKMVSAEMYPKRRGVGCMGCSRYGVSATMVGLVEFAGASGGFGHLNGFPVQFVLQSVEGASVKDLAVNYDPNDFATTKTRFPTGYISGTLRGPNGELIRDADLEVYQAENPEAHIEDDSATTDDRGRFRFAVPPGRYIVGFNTFWTPSQKFPYPPTYYPGTEERPKAGVIEVEDEAHIRHIDVRVPRTLTPRKIGVLVLWPNGAPVADANVWLSPKTEPTLVVGISVSHTNTEGKFDLTGFEGTDYLLHANKYGGLARVSCAKSILIPSSRPIEERITMRLSITDFNICKNADFDVPPDVQSVP